MLRGAHVPAGAVSGARRLDDVAWLHIFLAELAGLGFPSPRPLTAFGGQSWTIAGGRLWELASFIPGREVGWAAEPSMEQIGALLARYHCAARRIRVTGERDGMIPLASVSAILLSGPVDKACPDPEQAAVIRRLAGRLAADLEDFAHRAAERLVIHGDFTNNNVIADGNPPTPVGVIDFQRAHVEVPLADIAYGLWRSGRPHQDADCLDLTRLGAFVRGYASTIPFPASGPSATCLPLRPRLADDRQADPGGPGRNRCTRPGAMDRRQHHCHSRHRSRRPSIASACPGPLKQLRPDQDRRRQPSHLWGF